MGIVESYEKRTKTPKPEKPPEPSLRDILSDPNQSKLFGMFLSTRKEGVELGQKVTEKKLTGEDLLKLERERQEFVKRLQMLERAREIFPSVWEEVVARTPELLQLREMLMKRGEGDDGLRRAIFSQLDAIAMLDFDRFTNIMRRMEDLHLAMQKREQLNTEIAQLRERYGGIGEEELSEILTEKDEIKRKKKLKKLLRKHMFAYGIAADAVDLIRKAFTGRKTRIEERAEILSANVPKIEDRIKELDRMAAGLAIVLDVTSLRNPDVVRAINEILAEGEPKSRLEMEASFQEVREDIESPQKIIDDFKGWWFATTGQSFDDLKNRIKTSQNPVREWENEKPTWERYIKEKSREWGGGFWSTVGEKLLEEVISHLYQYI